MSRYKITYNLDSRVCVLCPLDLAKEQNRDSTCFQQIYLHLYRMFLIMVLLFRLFRSVRGHCPRWTALLWSNVRSELSVGVELDGLVTRL